MKRISKTALFILFILLGLKVEAQNQLEIGAKIGLQSPQFWNGSFEDILTEKDNRTRPAWGAFTKYHISKVWLVEYDLDLSWEGGGFEKRRTNLTFLKNTLFVGASTNIYKKNSFNLKIGATHNTLLSARLVDEYANQKTNVSKYIKVSSFSFPFSIGYVRRINENYTIGLNAYFQFFSTSLSSQDHIEYGQTLRRFEIKVTKIIIK